MKHLFVFQIWAILLYLSSAQNGLSMLRWAQKVRDNEERLKKIIENRQLLSNMKPSFDSFLKTPGQFVSSILSGVEVSEKCRSDFQLMSMAAENLFLNTTPGWDSSFIITQLDACGKPGAGVLHGKLEFMGAYLECISINAPPPPDSDRTDSYQGGFCKAFFALNPLSMGRKKRSIPHTEAACTGALLGGTGVLITEDLCLPKGCANDRDATLILQNITGGIKSPVCRVACLDPEENVLSWRGVLVAVITCLTLAVILIGTVVDYCWYQDNKDHSLAKAIPVRVLLAFSFYTNTVEIFAAKNRPGTIGSVHCIRYFSMVWVITGHMFEVALLFSDNILDMLPLIKEFSIQAVSNAFFSVDSFFFLSGLLLSFMWFKELKKNRKAVMSPSAWIMFYVHRIIRLSPPYFMVIAFSTWVLPYFLKQTTLFIGADYLMTGSCPQNWWINFLYLNNIIDYKNQCYSISWYLATDMQIHLFAPLVLIPLAISPLIGFIVSGLLFFLSAAAAIFTIYYFHMPPSPFGSPYSVRDPQFTVDPAYYTFYVYDAPWIRFPIYLIGILLGYYLQNNKRKVTISKVVNIVGWALSFAVMLTVVFGLYDYMSGTEVSIFWRAIYTAFSKTAWGLGLSWIVYSCHYGYGGPINRFMSWNIWIPLGRLTYCAYLVHISVAMYISSTSYQALHWSGNMDLIIHQLLPTIVLSYMVAIVWSPAFEISTSKVEMIFLGGLRGREHREEHQLDAPKADNANGTWVIAADMNDVKF